MKRISVLSALFLCAACAVSPLHRSEAHNQNRLPADETKPGLSLLFVSDIHFNPLTDSSIVPSLISSPASQWESIFSKAKNHSLNRYGTDTDYSLLKSAMAAMKAKLPQPDLIVISGDFVAHKFQRQFHQIVPHSTHRDYAQFFNKTEQYLAFEFIKEFPRVEILPVLGNNDSPCGDYMSQPDGAYLRVFAQAWQPAVNRLGGAPHFVAQFSKDGYYSALIREKNTVLRVVALNDDFWMSHYKNKCGVTAYNAGPSELNWLNQTLRMSSKHNEPVWLITHGPAGIDLVSTMYFHPNFCRDHLFSMVYKEPYNSQFVGLVDQNQNNIRLMLAGHTHMNEFRVYGAEGDAPVAQLVAPSVSPIFKNNPSFDVLSVAPDTFSVRDVKTYSLNLAAADADSQTPVQPWVRTSDLDQNFQIRNASGRSLYRLKQELKSNNKLFSSYSVRFMSGSAFPGFAMRNPPAYACSLSHFTVQGFSTCYCK